MLEDTDHSIDFIDRLVDTPERRLHVIRRR
jgi:hypothetical protein